MKNKKILTILPGIMALLMIGAVLGWASPCKHMLETVNGSTVHMSCFYLRVPAFIMACTWLGISIDGLYHKKMSAFLLIISGILTILVTICKIVGIGICANTEMACHTTVWWMRGLGFAVIMVGLLSLYDPEKQV